METFRRVFDEPSYREYIADNIPERLQRSGLKLLKPILIL